MKPLHPWQVRYFLVLPWLETLGIRSSKTNDQTRAQGRWMCVEFQSSRRYPLAMPITLSLTSAVSQTQASRHVCHSDRTAYGDVEAVGSEFKNSKSRRHLLQGRRCISFFRNNNHPSYKSPFDSFKFEKKKMTRRCKVGFLFPHWGKES